MLSKEECEVVVAKLYQNGYVDLTDCDIIAKLIKEHFAPQPYKFEDLKEDEPLWDSKCECWRHNMQTDTDNPGFYDTVADEWVDFEENRFFQVQCANVRCE